MQSKTLLRQVTQHPNQHLGRNRRQCQPIECSGKLRTQPITVTQPTAEEVIRFPRVFALLKQLQARERDGVSVEKLQELSETHGSGSKVPTDIPEGVIPFRDLATLLHKPGVALPEGTNCLGYAAREASGPLSPWTFQRRECAEDDVRIQVTHCGICHTDLFLLRNIYGFSRYPMVPGHEIVGYVTEVGSKVNKHNVGDKVGVGCIARSCGKCNACDSLEEQFCTTRIMTYNSYDIDGSVTYGGYSSQVVVNERFVLRVPDNLPLPEAAPLLCAGVTTYGPLVHYGLNKPGMTLGVVGLGGLGHLAVKFGKAFGMKVVVFSTSPNKKKEALEVLGADEFIISKDPDAMASVSNSLNGIIDTVSAPHELGPYLKTLAVDGKLIVVGAGEAKAVPFLSGSLIMKRLTVAGSLIGGTQRTQEMLDFCSQHNISCTVEVIPADYINTALERLEKNDVYYRFVIDVQNSIVPETATP